MHSSSNNSKDKGKRHKDKNVAAEMWGTSKIWKLMRLTYKMAKPKEVTEDEVNRSSTKEVT